MPTLKGCRLPFEIPSYDVYMGNCSWESEKNNSKYFDLPLEEMDELKKEHLGEVCGGIPWDC